MRGPLRALVVLALLLSGTSLAPHALADDASSPPAPVAVAGADDGTDPGTGDTATDPPTGDTDTETDTETDTGADPGTSTLTAEPPTTTIDSRPAASSAATTATLGFHADQAAATFECRLTGPGHDTDTFAACAPTAVSDPVAGTTTGSKSYTGLAPGAYTFAVRATTVDGGTEDPAVVATWTVTPTAATTTIVRRPAQTTSARSVTYTFSANRSGVSFQCRLTGPGRTATTYRSCSRTGTTYTGLRAGRYVFDVHATLPGSPPLVGADAEDTFTVVDTCATLVTKCPVKVLGSYAVPGGATFNNPVGSTANQRRNLTHVIRTINSMPGFRVPVSRCPSNPALWPGTIRISLYSATDTAFAKALVAAHRRCISVQILMNNHLTAEDTHAIKVMQTGLGQNRSRRSFAYRCSAGCRGWGVQHSKFYLFNSTLPAPRTNRITSTVIVGSSNMTSNAAKVQWNDLYTVRGNRSLHKIFYGQFLAMKRDRAHGRLVQASDASGVYQATFWPARRGATDPRMSALRSVRCTGANGGTGIGGRTVVYVNMHAWFESRGTALAGQVRRLYNQGCYVRVLYSFMTRAILRQLTAGTGSRMSARRTLFSRGGVFATLYSHHKMFAVSGHLGSDRSAKVVWTGSNNFTNGGSHFDEVMLRIRSAAAFAQYRRQFAFISATRSSSTWAKYREPNGGGRAPVPENKAVRAG